MRTLLRCCLTVGLLCWTIPGCLAKQSMTRGADGAREWDRRLREAVPVNSPVAEAQAALVRDGFRCDVDAAKPDVLTCEKLSANGPGCARRRWQARLQFTDGRVTRIEGSTALGRR